MVKASLRPGLSGLEWLGRQRAAKCCLSLSRLAFFATIVLLPSTVFWQVVPRHIGLLEPQYTSLLLYLSDVPMLAAIFAWTLAHFVWPSRSIRLGPAYVASPALAIVLLSALSTAWARATPIAAEVAGRTLILFGFYLIAANEPRVQTLLAKALVVGMVIHAPLAVTQFVTQAPLGIGFLGEIAWRETTPGAWLRGYGLSLHPNVLGGFLALGLLSFVGLALTKRRLATTLRSSRIARICNLTIASCVFTLGVAGLLSTFSRSAWLGLGAGLVYFGAFSLGQRGLRRALIPTLRWIGLLLVVVVLFAALYSPLLVTRLVLPTVSVLRNQPANGARLELNVLEERNRLHQAAFELIAAEPVRGVGAGNFTLGYYEQLGPIEPFRLYQPEHNVPFLVTAELGPLGGIAWVFLAVAPSLSLLRRSSRGARLWPYIWAAAVLTVFVISEFDFYFWERQQGRALFWGLLGAWVASREKQECR